MSQFSNKELQEYAWQYFALHASQRMSLFNFFVASSSVVTAALCGTFHEKVRAYEMGIVLAPKQASFPIVRHSVVAVFVGAQPSYSSRLAG